ncbi:metallophosphoesterase [Burkholderia sp. BCC1972]|uniref:metallophosphoesterase n=1 Tax=Burkholderia sp. BCC1972 TaxID=2817438 RepID=UPI002ABE73E4|nr:metallophosphoesterase [Burkholderia sp. BCC1972]
MKFAILHLSDIHIRNASDEILSRAGKIACTLNPVLPQVSCLFLIITGDIAFSGKKSEYDLARSFVREIIKDISGEFSGKIHCVFVPGNHDGEFKGEDNSRKAAIQGVLDVGEGFIDESIIENCTRPQVYYFEFDDEFCASGVVFKDKLWKQYRFDVGGKSVSISAINASWLSRVPEEQGSLVFPVDNYKALTRENADLKIGLMHHPLNWYAQGTYHRFRDFCRNEFQIVMSGHEHVSGTQLSIDLENRRLLTVEAAALAPHEHNLVSSFSVITVDLDEKQFAKEEFEWHAPDYLAKGGNGVWDSFVTLPEQKNDDFTLTDETRSFLEDTGAAFTHGAVSKISLSDIFVFPDLHEGIEGGEMPKTVSSDILRRQIDTLGRVIILGDDQHGKSSLLMRLYRDYLNSGFIPVLMSGAQLTNASDEQFLKKLNAAVAQQYGEAVVQKYGRLKRKQKILLLDDLDDVGARGDIVGKALKVVRDYFDYCIVTVSERFEVAGLLSEEANEVMKGFRQYRLTGFGYRLRGELVKKWSTLYQDQDELQLQKRVHESEVVINSVFGKALVPPTAFNVLVLLQTIESNQKALLVNAGLAQYYEYLIRKSLLDAKVRGDELEEVLKYLANFAWHLHGAKSMEVSEHEFKKFNISFSKNVYDTDFGPRADLLVRSNVVVISSGSYGFKYPYIYYFFLAKYISQELDDNGNVRNLVEGMCQHLYLKENANTILFLTHHSSSKWIIRMVAQSLRQLFDGVKPIKIETCAVALNDWVSEKARIAIDATDVEANRVEQRERHDSVSSGDDSDIDVAEVTSLAELDPISQIFLVFKTSEILGTVLKARYGSFDNSLKIELLRDLFDSPLKCMQFFFNSIDEKPEAMIQRCSAMLMERSPKKMSKDIADRVAKKFIFDSLGFLAEAFVSRQGELMGSPKLKSVYESLCDDSGAASDRLISVAAQLTYPNHVPLSEIQALANEFKNNYFAFRLLQGIVGRHLYMFSLPVDERQRLASAVSIDVMAQKTIEMNSRETKKLPNASRPRHSRGLLSRLKDNLLLQSASKKD